MNRKPGFCSSLSLALLLVLGGLAATREAAAQISIQIRTNGQSAQTPPGPAILVGDPVQWTYTITNTGDVSLGNVVVTDSQGVTVTAPKTMLAPGESMTATASGQAIYGQYVNVGTVSAMMPDGAVVTDSDISHYTGVMPSISIETLTNWEDADEPPGPKIPVGSSVHWIYVITNTGDVFLNNVVVTDSQGVTVTAPKTMLAPGESMTATASGIAVAGQYSNIGTVSGTAFDYTCTDSDPSHYYGLGMPSLAIEVLTNGEHADEAPGPSVMVGSAVTWTYVVANTGDVRLTFIGVTDDRGVEVVLPKTSLEPGESMTGIATGFAMAGQYSNLGTATGTAPDGQVVTVSDPSHYYGEIPWPEAGYWKTHRYDWPPTGYSTGQPVGSVLANASRFPDLASSTLLKALSFKGGPGVEGGAQILLRQAVAALLNASHPDIAYPLTPMDVITRVNAALTGDRADMLQCADYLATGGFGYVP